ncbi:Trypsin-7 [Eumeta japonica]|uniref:Trypsin-7 n=1 Tax=Eumeta variegata TaxID=151549 RepID=A0A4C1TLV7_EUMVA|nr:Trypsin-7 [Eumeta japonica]
MFNALKNYSTLFLSLNTVTVPLVGNTDVTIPMVGVPPLSSHDPYYNLDPEPLLDFNNDPPFYYGPTPKKARSHCCNGCGERGYGVRIVGGTPAQRHSSPWLARLLYRNSFGCGASIVNTRHVITAAHCVKGFMWFMFRVTFGEHDRCSTVLADARYVVSVAAHNFSLSDLRNDIALLKLSSSAVYSNAVKPICLPKNDLNTYAGVKGLVAGWGATAETGNWSCTLLQAEMPVLEQSDCRRTSYNANKIADDMLCAGYPTTAEKDACTGDSGGPLIADTGKRVYELIGVVSWGYGCARKGFPGIYTRVSKYLDWIKDNTDSCYCTS